MTLISVREGAGSGCRGGSIGIVRQMAASLRSTTTSRAVPRWSQRESGLVEDEKP